MMLRWINKQQGIHTFEIGAVTIKIFMIEYHHKPSDLWVILTQQSMVENECGKFGHLYNIHFSEALNDAFEV